jgi:hypothetical protein
MALSNYREKPYRLEVRNDEDHPWRFIMEFDEYKVEIYREIIEKISL